MSDALYWFGLLHLTVYALAGFSFAFLVMADWLLGRFKLKRDLIMAAHRMFKERNEQKALKGTSPHA